ncbi:CRISPR-associated endonuclease Cas1 [Thermomonas paludicola]|uniref:CRISPR-associated endonuclease Cas1 n=1 Tax=Thermomonas paludicola TaxID=2884874 RepID=UPI002114EFB6|nr:CRISPR-associated endonuclease Cas1 [Thermomonas paludicola]
MHTLLVDHQGATLAHEAGALCVRDGGGVLQRVPLTQVARVIVENDALLSVQLVRQLAAAGIPLVIARGRSRASAALLAPVAGDARRRLRQTRAWLDAGLRLELARHVVRLRLRSQIRNLRGWAGEAPALRYPLLRAARALRRLHSRIQDAPALPSLRGLEGVAGRVYFSAMRLLLAPALGFDGRRRRPPTDPVNAALSLGFTMLHGRALEAAHRAGLDACIGALHEPAHGRASLACDLMEAERAAVERLVVQLFRSRALEAHHFGRSGQACLLGKEGRGPFFGQLEPVLRRADGRMARRIARLLAQLPALPA